MLTLNLSTPFRWDFFLFHPCFPGQFTRKLEILPLRLTLICIHLSACFDFTVSLEFLTSRSIWLCRSAVTLSLDLLILVCLLIAYQQNLLVYK